MGHRLIIIDGPSTVGKSSVSKSVYQQIAREHSVYWLHEECANHPIRDGEFTAGDLHTVTGMESNREQMLAKWRQFAEAIRKSNEICVLEGCFLHALDRYLLQSSWSEREIRGFYGEIIELLSDIDPLVVFLYRPNLRFSFEKAFQARGNRWRAIIMAEPQPYGYFKTNAYTGDESIFANLLFEQECMEKIFEVLSSDKVRIDTSEERWDEYTQEITEAAGYTYLKEMSKLPDPNKYCGIFRVEDGEAIWTISFDEQTELLYSSVFWPYMPMKYQGEERFEFISFPITLQFAFLDGEARFTVQGNYDWGNNGKIFRRVQ